MSQRKKTVIDILRDSPDFVSGEAMSATLGISRNAVHKHVKSLRTRGYRILGVSRRGYRLEDEPCRLSMGHVTERTENSMFGRSFRYYDEIESTNARGEVARQQGRARGHRGDRRGADGGARPPRPPLDLAGRQGPPLLRAPAALAAHERGPPAHPRRRLRRGRGHRDARAARRVTIKWPNDLFIGDRKVGGILMEVSGEQDEVDWVVVGIGVNVNTEYSELPVALRRTATSLKMTGGEPVDRSELLATPAARPRGALPERRCANGFEQALSGFRERDYLLAQDRQRADAAKGRSSAPPPASTSAARCSSSCRTATSAASTPAT